MGIMDEINAGMEDDGTYDLKALKQAKEALSPDKDVNTDGMEEVDPLFIPVSDGEVVRTEEYKARVVMVDYDQYDEVVSVELL